MSRNMFELALGNNETNDFFRGGGAYFIRSPDYGEHVHGANMSGAIGTFLNDKPQNYEFVSKAFVDFIGSLELTQEDLNHLLLNLSSYFALKKKGKLIHGKLFSEPNLEEGVLLENYIKLVCDSTLYITEKAQVLRHAKYMHSNGSSTLMLLLKKYGEVE